METETETEKVYIALGSNMGDRESYLAQGLARLRRLGAVSGISRVYQSEPVGYADQGRFLNMACSMEVSLNPFELLEGLREIEDALARKRLIRWGPRTIDLDILLYGERAVTTPSLTIPHERMFQRAFVLAPLQEIYPYAEIGGVTFKDLLEACADKDGLSLYRPDRDTVSGLNRR
ncbi:MAG: 2-amino-4-hydroxy-6-hydroxymethyldihydropteridine diphosphokinase [Spirochaetaceae bacterium]|jgi:2-amino-4-hydroxy-6-hydroxymethyldihydropteridine diphosphokinase|nr:2-amino-4-hydroxy-6-hydroxymethyldihydropteridine diphosphokinase [Spirochaetaceae bacterium]